MPYTHIAITTTPAKFEETVAFYKKAIAPLGYSETANYGTVVGFGIDGKNDFWIFSKETMTFSEGPGFHFAFLAKDKKAVAAFHEAGLATGGKDQGPPGPRPKFGPKYYGAFVIDPMGNNVEVTSYDADQE
ncbi:uncharacterized protein BDZ99DRAFT_464463 [Mytilinidion resinicola]|uniref:Glyoxalase/Bleomycin resistance protein/Dihydroxybiphenyl dioxygenase n=1 Tax=Mytilinidion resinicola TaxID=574789 RepID=A0A6A6YL70_9PEZI|nr:uncharacterized protein BDZ99DRAFT_464463 [Mytilinidion resinicola]KAF2808617.1 hypothetical protein BDZ99DRAFT_464463 [Mytilinidion resinicola]